MTAFAGLGRFLRFYSLLALLSMPPLALSQDRALESIVGPYLGGITRIWQHHSDRDGIGR